MKRRIAMTFVAGLCLLGLATATGCLRSNRLSENWGRAANGNMARQVIDPHAGYQEAPTGLGSMTNRHVVDNYDKNQANQGQQTGNSRRGSGIVIGDFD